MGLHTNIEWCDSTINPTTGCDGCELWNGHDTRVCYAGRLHEGRLAKSLPLLYDAHFANVRLAPGRMLEAARWPDLRDQDRPGKPWLNGLPRLIFVGDMGDVFSRAVPDDYLCEEVFGAICSPAGRRHFWLLLTKQIVRLAAFSQTLGWLATVRCQYLGGESGSAAAQPMQPDWVRMLRDDCTGAGVPFFFKQWDKKRAPVIDGRQWKEMPSISQQ